jgi:glycosyltransferase involved in cell wall biosynthesis
MAVESCLAQRDADVRVVIVDDGSDDGYTPAACDGCLGRRVRVIHQENRGLPAARNRGAAGAGSEYLAFLDADDWVEPTFTARLHGAIRQEAAGGGGEDISHAYCQERLVEKGSGVWRVPDWDPLLMMITNLHPVTALVRRACFEAVGGFDESMRHGYEDWELWLRFVERGWRGARVREPLFVWRRHSDSTMVMNVIGRHDELYAGIRARHRALFDRHLLELVARSNSMLRNFDMIWLDEDLRPINLVALKGQRRMYESMLAVRLDRLVRRAFRRLRPRRSPPLPPAPAGPTPPEPRTIAAG